MFNPYKRYFVKLIFKISWISVNIAQILKILVKHLLILVKHRFIFSWEFGQILTMENVFNENISHTETLLLFITTFCNFINLFHTASATKQQTV